MTVPWVKERSAWDTASGHGARTPPWITSNGRATAVVTRDGER